MRIAFVLALAACGSQSERPRENPPIIVAAPAPPAPPPSPPVAAERAIPSAPAPAAYQPHAIDVAVHGHGRPIIFIPGLGCDPTVFESTIAHLGDGFESHLVSFAGYAGMPAIKEPLLATAREDLVAYIKDRQLDHPIVIGHSLGGFMAFWLAATEPDLVGGVVNLDATPNFYSDSSIVSLRAKADEWRAMGKAEFQDTLRNYYNPMASRNRSKLLAQIEKVIKSDQRAYVESFVEMARIDIVPKVGAITVPVLSVLADSQYFYEYVKGQTARIKNNKVVMLKDTRHFVFFDDPESYFRLLDAFLAAR